MEDVTLLDVYLLFLKGLIYPLCLYGGMGMLKIVAKRKNKGAM